MLKNKYTKNNERNNLVIETNIHFSNSIAKSNGLVTFYRYRFIQTHSYAYAPPTLLSSDLSSNLIHSEASPNSIKWNKMHHLQREEGNFNIKTNNRNLTEMQCKQMQHKNKLTDQTQSDDDDDVLMVLNNGN